MYHFTYRKRRKFNNIKYKTMFWYLRKHLIFRYTLHKELWQYLIDNPNKDKKDWPRWKSNGGDIEKIDDNCFACEYKLKYPSEYFYTCYKCCPFKVKFRSACLNGLYEEWNESEDLNKRSKLAKQIKKFPMKKSVKYI